MSFLRAMKLSKRSDIPKDIKEELSKVWEDFRKARQRNDELVAQVNNLLHFINEQNRRKRELQQRITTNPKTGLPNHNKMDQDLHSFFDSLSTLPDQPSVAVVLIRLGNNFDIINKTLKPSVSEWIIYQISTRLRDALDENTLIYHPRDDEFFLIISDQGDKKSLTPLVEELYQRVSNPHIFSGYHITIDCQIGISIFPQDGMDKSRLLHNADIALNYAKRNHKKYVYFIEKMREEVVNKMELQNSIIKALEEQTIKQIDKQFFIYLQPIVTVDKIVDDEPVISSMDAEALIRWCHPTRGVILPDAFIPIAEETGLIIIIGKWVLYTASEQIYTWQESREVESVLAINVSPRQFNNNDLLNSIERIINYKSINPELLQLEITENSFLEDPPEAIKKIKKLKDMGVRIAIDDFGTGFSSVNYLRQLPVNVVKIDRSFITDIDTSSQDRSIIKAIISLTRELGMENVVEGVETLEQLKILMNFGLTRFQGYLFSKAMMEDEFRAYYHSKISG